MTVQYTGIVLTFGGFRWEESPQRFNIRGESALGKLGKDTRRPLEYFAAQDGPGWPSSALETTPQVWGDTRALEMGRGWAFKNILERSRGVGETLFEVRRPPRPRADCGCSRYRPLSPSACFGGGSGVGFRVKV